MSIRNAKLGGTDFTDGEVLYDYDLDDTNNAIIDLLCPVGGIIAWHKNMTGVPALTTNFAECDGSVISDASSPMNGQTLPNLNGTTESTKLFLRGSTTSGTTGGRVSHTHLMIGSGSSGAASSYTTGETTESHIPPYMDVVWIMRIK